MVKISIIIPIYNGEKNIQKALSGILSQSLKEIEVICIDDGSTDNTLNIINTFSSEDNRVVGLHQDNLGAGPARNNGIDHSHGKYLIFFDSDDHYFDEFALEKLFCAAEENDVNICGGNIVFQPESGELYKDNGVNFETGLLEFYDIQCDYWFHRFIFKRSFVIENHLRFPNYLKYQDPVFLLRAMILSRMFYYINEDIYVYSQRHSSHLNLNTAQVVDGFKGLTENLKVSSRHKLKKLHIKTYKTVIYHINTHVYKLLPSNNIQLFSAMIKCNESINVDWLKEEGYQLEGPFMLPPLSEYWYAGNNYLKIRKNPLFRILIRVAKRFRRK